MIGYKANPGFTISSIIVPKKERLRKRKLPCVARRAVSYESRSAPQSVSKPEIGPYETQKVSHADVSLRYTLGRLHDAHGYRDFIATIAGRPLPAS